MSYVSTTYLPRCFRMYHVCVTYVYGVSDLLRTCYEFLSAHIKKRSTSAYEEYELRIEEYELRMAMYLRRTCDVPFVSRYAVDT